MRGVAPVVEMAAAVRPSTETSPRARVVGRCRTGGANRSLGSTDEVPTRPWMSDQGGGPTYRSPGEPRASTDI